MTSTGQTTTDHTLIDQTDGSDTIGVGWERPGLADREGPLTEWQAATRDYRLTLDWSAWVYGQWVWIQAHDIEALDVPARLGRPALNLLRENGITPTVFAVPDPGGARRVFLLERRDLTWLQRRERLTELGAEHVWAGVTLDLPPSQYNGRRLHWITGPTLPLPEYTVVADAIIQAGAAPAR